MRRQRIVVGFARVSNCYGGPEEGGWYYDAGTPVDELGFKTFFNIESAREYREYLESLIGKKDRFNGVGVGGCGDDEGMYRGQATDDGLSVEIQYKPAKSRGGITGWPDRRPHYE